MAKPRSKVLRKASGKPNPEIQRVLSLQAQKKRYDTWVREDAAWEPESRCTATATSECTVECGNPSCVKYSVIYDPYYSPPPNSLILNGIPLDRSGRPCEVDPDLPYLLANGSKVTVEDVAPVAHAQAIVSFASFEEFDLARKAGVVSFGTFLYTTHGLPMVSKMLLNRMQSMEDHDQALDFIDSEDDPLVGAALIPGLHRREFTKPIPSGCLNFSLKQSEQQRLSKLLGKS